jgi:hypothetical protein
VSVASAAAEPVELYGSLDRLLGLFDPAWRRGYWPDGFPPRVAPRAIELALGSLAHGTGVRSPEEVRDAVRALAELDVEALPRDATPWADGVDREGDLDELLRMDLRALRATFEAAARDGWAIDVLAPR